MLRLLLIISLLICKNSFPSDFDTVKEKIFPKLLKSYVVKPKKSKNKDAKPADLPYSTSEYYLSVKYSGAIALGMFYEKHKNIYPARDYLFEKYVKYAFPKGLPDNEAELLRDAVRYGQLIYKYKNGKIYVKKSEQVLKKIDKIDEFPKTVIEAVSADSPKKEEKTYCTGACVEALLKILSKEQYYKHDKHDKRYKKPQIMSEVRGMESDALSILTESAMPEIQRDIYTAIAPVLDICKNNINEDDPLLDLFNFLTDVPETEKLEKEREYCLSLISLWMGEEPIDKEQKQKVEEELLKISILPGAGSMFKADKAGIYDSVDELYTYAFATYGNNIRLGMDMFSKIRDKKDGALLLNNGALSAQSIPDASLLAAISKDADVILLNLPEPIIDMGFSAISTIQDDRWKKLQKLIVRSDNNIKDSIEAASDIFDARLQDEKFLNLTSIVGRAAVYAVKGIETGKKSIDDLYLSFRDNLKFISFLNILGMENVKDTDFIEKISITIPRSNRKCLKVRNRRGRIVCRY